MANDSDYSIAFQAWLDNICTAYNGVLPSGVEPTTPYILYDGYIDSYGVQFIQPLKIYVPNSTDIGDVLAIVDDIDDAVGEGGCMIHAEKVNVFIKKGSPFYQPLESEDEAEKAGYVNLLVKIYQKEI